MEGLLPRIRKIINGQDMSATVGADAMNEPGFNRHSERPFISQKMDSFERVVHELPDLITFIEPPRFPRTPHRRFGFAELD